MVARGGCGPLRDLPGPHRAALRRWAIVVLLVLRGTAAQASLGALVGGVLTGALVQRLFAPTQPPVGVATSAVGGVYLAVLLVRGRRRG
jgi:ABC-type enterobactin transport system permease subunit